MKEKHNIVMLDFDGVMNNQLYYEKNHEKINERMRDESDKFSYLRTQIDPNAVEVLNNFIEETNAKIVISSTWRKAEAFQSMDNIADFFKDVGIKGECIGVTPIFDSRHTVRGNEIHSWLQKNKEIVKNYVIFDDDGDMLLWQKNHYFRVDGYIGLTSTVTYRAARFLNGEII